MAEVQVRGMEPQDMEAVHEILNCPGVVAGTLQLPLRSLEERRERLAQRPPGTHSLVAAIDGRVVGQVGLQTETNPRRRHVGRLGMAVHDDWQGRGVGRALLAAVVDLADHWLGLRRLELQVYTDNARAIHLYEQVGFVIEGTLRDFAFRGGAYVDAHSMARLHR